MFGFLLIALGTLFVEASDSIGKIEIKNKSASIYTIGFLTIISALPIYLFIIIFIRHQFLFSLASLPTFSARAILEIVQSYVTVRAIATADRSTFSFIRTGTMPILLVFDILLGYTIRFNQIVGIFVIFFTLLFLFMNRGIRTRGIGFVIFSTINSSLTLSLYKYNITHFNSVEAEQLVISVIVMCYFFISAMVLTREDPLFFLKKPIFITQSFSQAIGAILQSFAYLFAPASIINTAERSMSVFWSVLSGNFYFHERHILVKIFAVVSLAIGLVLLVK